MMKDLILKSSEWYRRGGDLTHSSVLMDEFNGKCCLGVLSYQEGVPAEMLLGTQTPQRIISKFQIDLSVLPESLHWMFKKRDFGGYRETLINSEDAQRLMLINDDFNTTDEEKIKEMTPIFASHGFNLIFKKDE